MYELYINTFLSALCIQCILSEAYRGGASTTEVEKYCSNPEVRYTGSYNASKAAMSAIPLP